MRYKYEVTKRDCYAEGSVNWSVYGVFLVDGGALEKCPKLKKFLELKGAKTALPVKRWTLQPPKDGESSANPKIPVLSSTHLNFYQTESDIGGYCSKLSMRALTTVRCQ